MGTLKSCYGNQNQEHIRHTRSGELCSPLPGPHKRDKHLTLRQHGPTLNHHRVSAVFIKDSPPWLGPPLLTQPTGLCLLFQTWTRATVSCSRCCSVFPLTAAFLHPCKTLTQQLCHQHSPGTGLVHHLINTDSVSGRF